MKGFAQPLCKHASAMRQGNGIDSCVRAITAGGVLSPLARLNHVQEVYVT